MSTQDWSSLVATLLQAKGSRARRYEKLKLLDQRHHKTNVPTPNNVLS